MIRRLSVGETPFKIFTPLGKTCWKGLKTIGHSLKSLGPNQKTISPTKY